MSDEVSPLDGESRRSRVADGVFAVAMIGAAVATLVELRKQPRSPFDPVGAAAIPGWTAWIVIALASLLLLRIAFGRSTAGSATSLFVGIVDQAELDYRLRPGLAVACFVLTLAFAALVPLLGFRMATVGYMLILGWLLCDRSVASLAITAGMALAGGIGLDALFRHVLFVPLP